MKEIKKDRDQGVHIIDVCIKREFTAVVLVLVNKTENNKFSLESAMSS